MSTVSTTAATGSPHPGSPVPPGPPPWWAWALAAVSVLSVLALIATAAGGAISALSQRSTDGVLQGTDVQRVQITAASARVTVIGDDTVEDVSGEWTTQSSLVDVGVTSTVRDGVMFIDLDCPPQRWFGPDCEGRLMLRMPPATQLSVDAEAASVTGRSLAGNIDATVNAGLITLTDLSSPSVRTSNNAGGVELRFIAPPDMVIASTNVGTVTVQVPQDGTTYAVTTSSNVGEETSDVPADVASRRFINASTNVGAVTVTTRDAGDDPGPDPPR